MARRLHPWMIFILAFSLASTPCRAEIWWTPVKGIHRADATVDIPQISSWYSILFIIREKKV